MSEATATKTDSQGALPQIQVYFLTGILGELPDCHGIAEDVIDTPEKLARWGLDPARGGTFIKVWGISYLYKGNPEQAKVFGMEQAKSNVITIPKDILGKSVLYMAAMALRFFFQRRRFMHDVNVFFTEILNKTLKHTAVPYERLNAAGRELGRAIDVALKKEYGVAPEVNLIARGVDFDHTDRRRLMRWLWCGCPKAEAASAAKKVAVFGVNVFERDYAYRSRIQDAFRCADKERASRRGGWREVLHLLKVLEGRETRYGIPGKWRMFRFALTGLFLFSPVARRVAHTFFQELDLEKVRPDEADWYYSLRRSSYDYGGMTLEERLAEAARIDKEKGHRFIKLEQQADGAHVVERMQGTPEGVKA